LLERTTESRERASARGRTRMRELRGADAAVARPKVARPKVARPKVAR